MLIVHKNKETETILEFKQNPFISKFCCKFCKKSFSDRAHRYKHEITCIKSIRIVSMPQQVSMLKKDLTNHNEDIPINFKWLKII